MSNSIAICILFCMCLGFVVVALVLVDILNELRRRGQENAEDD